MAHLHLMTRTALVTLVAAFTTGLSAPASAAWTTDCLWTSVPAADRASFVTAMSQDQKTAFATLNPARMRASAEACGVPKADAPDAQKAFAAYGSALGAIAALESRHGVTRSQVFSAWASLPNGNRTALVAIARNMHNEPQKVAVLQGASSQMAQRLSLGSDAGPQLRQLVYALALLQSLGRGGIGQ